MNRFYKDPQGNIYSGDRQGDDQTIPERPDDGKPYKWNGEWVEDISAENAVVYARLEAIDKKRIRALAEGGVNPETGKKYLDEYNEEAVTERAKLKK